MASSRAVTSQGRETTRIRVQTIDVGLSSPPEYPIGLKLLLNNEIHQRLQPVPTTNPLHWDNVIPIDAEVSDQVEVRIYEHHTFGFRRIRVGTVVFRANQADGLSTEITGGPSFIQAIKRIRGVDLFLDPYVPLVVDNTGLVPCSVKLTFLSPEEISSIPHSVNKLAATAVCDKPTILENMGRTRDVVGVILKIGQQVSELNPIAKVTFGLCNLAWQTLEKQDKYDKLVVDLVLSMSDLLPLVDAVKGQARIEQLQATIIEILRLVEDASRFVIDYESDGAAVRTIRAFVSSTAQEQVDEFLKQFKRLKEAFEIGMTAQMVVGVETVLKDTDQEILMKLIAPDAGYNPSTGCLRGTRATVQTEIHDWINSDNDSRSIYWISGLAGCGKSTVAHSACQYLDADSRLAGSFFCKRDKEQLNKPENVVSTIAANLGFQCQSYGAQLVAVLRKDPRIANKALLTRFEQMIVQPIQSMPSDTLPQTTFIVIDALDECGTTETRAELVKQIKKLARLAPWVKIVATSRRDHGLESYLKGDSVLRRDLSSDYRSSVTGDIEQLIRRRLKELMDDDEMLGSKPWLEDGTVARLTAQANELFIWAQTACNIICKSMNPDKKIDEMLSGGVSQDAMVHLHSLYGRILHETLGEVTGGADVVRSCIAAVVSTRVPLMDTDMARLLEGRVELVELRRVIRRLSSVLYRDQYGAIRVIHQSFGDYMRDEQCPLDYRTHKDRQNASFAVSCLQIMVKELKFNICQLEDSGLFNHEVSDLSIRIEKRIPTYLQYSCIYWADHLLTAGAYTNAFGEHQSTLGLLSLLLEGPQVLYWIEVMSLSCKLHECETALIELKSWVLSANSKLQRRVEEVQQLVTDFYLPISQSTPHLYVSALALRCVGWDSPQSSQNEFPNRVQIVRGTHLAKLTNRWTRPIPTRESVSAVAYSPDGRLLVASCKLKVLVDGRLIASSNSTSVHLWDAESGAALPSLHGWDSESQVLGVSSPDDQGILSVVLSRMDAVTFTVWNARTGVLLRSVQPKVFDRSYVALSSNGRFLAVSGFSKSIQVWDTDAIADTGAPTYVLRPPRSLLDSTRSITISPDGLRVAVCYGHQLKAFDVRSGHGLAVRAAYWRSPPTAVVFSRDGQRILCGKTDGSIDVWDASGMGIGTRWHNAQLPPGVNEWGMLSDWWSEDPETDWRRGEDGRLLLWVPYIYHNLTIEGRSSRLLTVSTNAQDHVVSFDFTKFKYGKDWASIHASDPPNHEPRVS